MYSAARPAGLTSDPSVSVPIEKGAYPAETPTAEPEDDPEVFYARKSFSFTPNTSFLSKFLLNVPRLSHQDRVH